jgi:NAD(P)-dependent dehydrogenase (short-subunit alcohol dehydrogenase family)
MAFTRALGSASIDKGVRVVGVNPGFVETERMVTLMRARAEDELGEADRWPELTTSLPAGRAARPAEVGELVCFLASDRASYITGVVVTIDGGAAARA